MEDTYKEGNACSSRSRPLCPPPPCCSHPPPSHTQSSRRLPPGLPPPSTSWLLASLCSRKDPDLQTGNDTPCVCLSISPCCLAPFSSISLPSGPPSGPPPPGPHLLWWMHLHPLTPPPTRRPTIKSTPPWTPTSHSQVLLLLSGAGPSHQLTAFPPAAPGNTNSLPVPCCSSHSHPGLAAQAPQGRDFLVKSRSLGFIPNQGVRLYV